MSLRNNCVSAGRLRIRYFVSSGMLKLVSGYSVTEVKSDYSCHDNDKRNYFHEIDRFPEPENSDNSNQSCP